ncbi:DUF2550 domain-containing protein [Krasilnikovia sp. M28-CT-15]|uniref:DUF2550 domain-containing protein n=1 Tax=Krasilnikovia sp. M28-CT-15 TaxID=3373540 RepID=UPI003875E177
MRILEFLGICVVALLVLLLALFLRRRLLIRGGGTIALQVRVHKLVPGRGWSAGIGQFVGDELRFHRMFSFAVRPKRVLNRRELIVDRPRLPEGPECRPIPDHWVVLSCATPDSRVEIAMADSTVTGFLSWLEAGPPGSAARRPVAAPRPAEY